MTQQSKSCSGMLEDDSGIVAGAEKNDSGDGREAFERYARQLDYKWFDPDKDGNGGYESPALDDRWAWWKASRAAMQVPERNCGIASADPAQIPMRMATPDGALPRFDPEKPRRKLLVTVEVPEDWERRGDMQWCLEREINADRWSWNWPAAEPAISCVACGAEYRPFNGIMEHPLSRNGCRHQENTVRVAAAAPSSRLLPCKDIADMTAEDARKLFAPQESRSNSGIGACGVCGVPHDPAFACPSWGTNAEKSRGRGGDDFAAMVQFNGQLLRWTDRRITYAQAVATCTNGHGRPETVYTVAYSTRSGRDGTLRPGQETEVEEGMVIDAMITGRA